VAGAKRQHLIRCWPYFLKDPNLASLRSLPEFELLISALQAKHPDHLGLLQGNNVNAQPFSALPLYQRYFGQP
jgi:hypothetical protein